MVTDTMHLEENNHLEKNNSDIVLFQEFLIRLRDNENIENN